MNRDDLRCIAISIMIFIVIVIMSYIIGGMDGMEESSDYTPTPVEINSVIFLF